MFCQRPIEERIVIDKLAAISQISIKNLITYISKPKSNTFSNGESYCQGLLYLKVEMSW